LIFNNSATFRVRYITNYIWDSVFLCNNSRWWV